MLLLLQNPTFQQRIYNIKFRSPPLDVPEAMAEVALVAQQPASVVREATTPSVEHPSPTKSIPLRMTPIHTFKVTHDEQWHKRQAPPLVPSMDTIIYHQPLLILRFLRHIRTVQVMWEERLKGTALTMSPECHILLVPKIGIVSHEHSSWRVQVCQWREALRYIRLLPASQS